MNALDVEELISEAVRKLGRNLHGPRTLDELRAALVSRGFGIEPITDEDRRLVRLRLTPEPRAIVLSFRVEVADE